jgi:hypothetical protein
MKLWKLLKEEELGLKATGAPPERTQTELVAYRPAEGDVPPLVLRVTPTGKVEVWTPKTAEGSSARVLSNLPPEIFVAGVSPVPIDHWEARNLTKADGLPKQRVR